ncbi:MAG: helix-turn-helix transcriptional regulator [Clostridia bacterium]|nr:helix-turn-helix transcriptional regulator [Clostridia bacterium]
MIEVKFKERLRELRKQNNFTQKVLGMEANVSEDSISDWERGKSEPCLRDLISLAIALDTTIDYLVGKELSIN